MDKASAYGAGDCRFESCRGHFSCRAAVALDALNRRIVGAEHIQLEDTILIRFQYTLTSKSVREQAWLTLVRKAYDR